MQHAPCGPLSPLSQVAREGFVIFFSEVFDAMFRLCADSEQNVQNAVQFLDNLVKVGSRPREHYCLFGWRGGGACGSGGAMGSTLAGP